MKPKSHRSRIASKPGSRFSRLASSFRPRVELLEDRKMLSATDLLVSGFESTGGQYVTRYNDVTHTPVPGGIFGGAGANDLVVAQGIATAPDGTFYVSSLFTGKVLHYAADSTFIDVLGAATHSRRRSMPPARWSSAPTVPCMSAIWVRTRS